MCCGDRAKHDDAVADADDAIPFNDSDDCLLHQVESSRGKHGSSAEGKGQVDLWDIS